MKAALSNRCFAGSRAQDIGVRAIESSLRDVELELYCFVEAAVTKDSENISRKCQALEIRLARDDVEVPDTGTNVIPPLYLMEAIRIEYINCINGISFQNEQISQLMSQLREAREELQVLQAKKAIIDELRSLEGDQDHHETSEASHAILDEMRSLKINIVNLKLDIEDRLNKRRMKETRKIKLGDELLKPLINEIQILAQVQSSSLGIQSAGVQCMSRVSPAKNQQRFGEDCNQLKRRGHRRNEEESALAPKSNYRVYSDEEIRKALKRCD
eukprot:315886-Hanusia_phi.AAC.5